MKTIDVYYSDVLAGQLSKMPDKTYEFAYNKSYLASRNNPAISLSFPKRAEPYRSAVLFPFFNNLLPEGASGSTIKFLTKGMIESLVINEPSINVLIFFNHIIEPIRTQKENFQSQIRFLTEASDRLLPKLMSGDIEIESLK